jgi:hypothetical protein
MVCDAVVGGLVKGDVRAWSSIVCMYDAGRWKARELAPAPHLGMPLPPQIPLSYSRNYDLPKTTASSFLQCQDVYLRGRRILQSFRIPVGWATIKQD